MKKLYWHIAGRFNEVRAQRALAAYCVLAQRAEKYFARLASRDSTDDRFLIAIIFALGVIA